MWVFLDFCILSGVSPRNKTFQSNQTYSIPNLSYVTQRCQANQAVLSPSVRFCMTRSHWRGTHQRKMEDPPSFLTPSNSRKMEDVTGNPQAPWMLRAWPSQRKVWRRTRITSSGSAQSTRSEQANLSSPTKSHRRGRFVSVLQSVCVNVLSFKETLRHILWKQLRWNAWGALNGCFYI
jgi:hypothetical protein